MAIRLEDVKDQMERPEVRKCLFAVTGKNQQAKLDQWKEKFLSARKVGVVSAPMIVRGRVHFFLVPVSEETCGYLGRSWPTADTFFLLALSLPDISSGGGKQVRGERKVVEDEGAGKEELWAGEGAISLKRWSYGRAKRREHGGRPFRLIGEKDLRNVEKVAAELLVRLRRSAHFIRALEEGERGTYRVWGGGPGWPEMREMHTFMRQIGYVYQDMEEQAETESEEEGTGTREWGNGGDPEVVLVHGGRSVRLSEMPGLTPLRLRPNVQFIEFGGGYQPTQSFRHVFRHRRNGQEERLLILSRNLLLGPCTKPEMIRELLDLIQLALDMQGEEEEGFLVEEKNPSGLGRVRIMGGLDIPLWSTVILHSTYMALSAEATRQQSAR